jgi:hypothetical protein
MRLLLLQQGRANSFTVVSCTAPLRHMVVTACIPDNNCGKQLAQGSKHASRARWACVVAPEGALYAPLMLPTTLLRKEPCLLSWKWCRANFTVGNW